MREIKFRIWFGPKKTGYMEQPVNPVWFEEHNYKYDDFAKCVNEVGGILMQFTELRDKNGKEIYQGDIIKYDNDEDIYVVDSPKWSMDQRIYGWNIYNEPMRILGNIYKNPELLK